METKKDVDELSVVSGTTSGSVSDFNDENANLYSLPSLLGTERALSPQIPSQDFSTPDCQQHRYSLRKKVPCLYYPEHFIRGRRVNRGDNQHFRKTQTLKELSSHKMGRQRNHLSRNVKLSQGNELVSQGADTVCSVMPQVPDVNSTDQQTAKQDLYQETIVVDRLEGRIKFGILNASQRSNGRRQSKKINFTKMSENLDSTAMSFTVPDSVSSDLEVKAGSHLMSASEGLNSIIVRDESSCRKVTDSKSLEIVVDEKQIDVPEQILEKPQTNYTNKQMFIFDPNVSSSDQQKLSLSQLENICSLEQNLDMSERENICSIPQKISTSYLNTICSDLQEMDVSNSGTACLDLQNMGISDLGSNCSNQQKIDASYPENNYSQNFSFTSNESIDNPIIDKQKNAHDSLKETRAAVAEEEECDICSIGSCSTLPPSASQDQAIIGEQTTPWRSCVSPEPRLEKELNCGTLDNIIKTNTSGSLLLSQESGDSSLVLNSSPLVGPHEITRKQKVDSSVSKLNEKKLSMSNFPYACSSVISSTYGVPLLTKSLGDIEGQCPCKPTTGHRSSKDSCRKDAAARACREEYECRCEQIPDLHVNSCGRFWKTRDDLEKVPEKLHSGCGDVSSMITESMTFDRSGQHNMLIKSSVADRHPNAKTTNLHCSCEPCQGKSSIEICKTSKTSTEISAISKTRGPHDEFSETKMKTQKCSKQKVSIQDLQSLHRLVALYDRMLDKLNSGFAMDGKTQLDKFEQIITKLKSSFEKDKTEILTSANKNGKKGRSNNVKIMRESQVVLELALEKHELLKQRVLTVQAESDKLQFHETIVHHLQETICFDHTYSQQENNKNFVGCPLTKQIEVTGHGEDEAEMSVQVFNNDSPMKQSKKKLSHVEISSTSYSISHLDSHNDIVTMTQTMMGNSYSDSIDADLHHLIPSVCSSSTSADGSCIEHLESSHEMEILDDDSDIHENMIKGGTALMNITRKANDTLGNMIQNVGEGCFVGDDNSAVLLTTNEKTSEASNSSAVIQQTNISDSSNLRNKPRCSGSFQQEYNTILYDGCAEIPEVELGSSVVDVSSAELYRVETSISNTETVEIIDVGEKELPLSLEQGTTVFTDIDRRKLLENIDQEELHVEDAKMSRNNPGLLGPQYAVNNPGLLQPHDTVNNAGLLQPLYTVNNPGLLQPQYTVNNPGLIQVQYTVNNAGLIQAQYTVNNPGLLQHQYTVNNPGLLQPQSTVYDNRFIQRQVRTAEIPSLSKTLTRKQNNKTAETSSVSKEVTSSDQNIIAENPGPSKKVTFSNQNIIAENPGPSKKVTSSNQNIIAENPGPSKKVTLNDQNMQNPSSDRFSPNGKSVVGNSSFQTCWLQDKEIVINSQAETGMKKLMTQDQKIEPVDSISGKVQIILVDSSAEHISLTPCSQIPASSSRTSGEVEKDMIFSNTNTQSVHFPLASMMSTENDLAIQPHFTSTRLPGTRDSDADNLDAKKKEFEVTTSGFFFPTNQKSGELKSQSVIKAADYARRIASEDVETNRGTYQTPSQASNYGFPGECQLQMHPHEPLADGSSKTTQNMAISNIQTAGKGENSHSRSKCLTLKNGESSDIAALGSSICMNPKLDTSHYGQRITCNNKGHSSHGVLPKVSVSTTSCSVMPEDSICAACQSLNPEMSLCTRCGVITPEVSFCLKCQILNPQVILCTKCQNPKLEVSSVTPDSTLKTRIIANCIPNQNTTSHDIHDLPGTSQPQPDMQESFSSLDPLSNIRQNLGSQPTSASSTVSSSLFAISTKEITRRMKNRIASQQMFSDSQKQMSPLVNSSLPNQVTPTKQPITYQTFSVQTRGIDNLVPHTSVVKHSSVSATSGVYQATVSSASQTSDFDTSFLQAQVNPYYPKRISSKQTNALMPGKRGRGRPKKKISADVVIKETKSYQINKKAENRQKENYNLLIKDSSTEESGSIKKLCAELVSEKSYKKAKLDNIQSETEKPSVVASGRIDVPSLISSLRTVRLIADAEVTGTSKDFPSDFWNEDFANIRMSQSFWDTVDVW